MLAERSILWVPSNNRRFVETAWTRGADAYILDLEASVADDQQGPAREGIRDAIPKVSRGGAEVIVRVNHRQWLADLEASIWPGVMRIIYPQPETAEHMSRLSDAIGRLERERGLREGSVEVYPIIETVRGVVNSYEIANATERIKVFGGGFLGFDTCRDLLIENRTGGAVRENVYYQAGECSLTARALGRRPLNGVGMDVNLSGDVTIADAAFERTVTNRKAGIFGGGGGLHPNLVEPSNRGAMPTDDEIDEAHRVLRFFDELDARGEVSGEMDGRIVDKHEVERALKLLDWADRCRRQRDRIAGIMGRATGEDLPRRQEAAKEGVRGA